MPKRIGFRKKLVRRRKFIREWRDHRDLSQEELGAMIGTSGTSISRIENGEQPFTEDTLEGIARALKTDRISLLTRDPAQPEDIISVWDGADDEQRRMIMDIARTVINKPGGPR